MSRHRLFDWDEAKRLRCEGMTYGEIANRLGVSESAVQHACNPEQCMRAKARTYRWQRQARCPDCGAQTTRIVLGGDRRCRSCASALLRKDPADWSHGTESTYKKRGCRCVACRKASRVGRAERRSRTKAAA